MSTMTLAIASAHYSDWLAADTAIAKGQSYTIGDRTLTRVHASEVRNQMMYWSKVEAEQQRIANGKGGVSISLAKFNL